MKRSRAVSLVLLAGAGVLAWSLAKKDPSQAQEDVAAFTTEGDCVMTGKRDAAECQQGFATATERHRQSAPRFASKTDCEAEYGSNACESGARYGAGSSFVPIMVGYMMGAAAQRGVPPQPLYGDPRQPQEEQTTSSGGGGGGGGGSGGSSSRSRSYKTAAGTTIRTSSGSPVARAPSSEVRSVSRAPRVVSRGGFGSSGRSISSRSSSSS
jgi:uncharacterized protein YgiB involved in biofilm formation